MRQTLDRSALGARCGCPVPQEPAGKNSLGMEKRSVIHVLAVGTHPAIALCDCRPRFHRVQARPCQSTEFSCDLYIIRTVEEKALREGKHRIFSLLRFQLLGFRGSLRADWGGISAAPTFSWSLRILCVDPIRENVVAVRYEHRVLYSLGNPGLSNKYRCGAFLRKW